jgi:hypothetical protein
MLPFKVSVFEFTTSTLFVAESNTSTVVLCGDVTMSPGAVPAGICETRGRMSLLASMITKPAADDKLDTPCDAKTRVVSPLGGLVMLIPLLQETKLKAVANIADKRPVLFKRQAPKCRKTIDLCVK